MGFCIGVGIAAFVVYILWTMDVIVFSWELDEHEHTWEVQGASQMKLVTVDSWGAEYPDSIKEDITEVLSRCTSCNEVATEQLKGHWTYEQLSGKPDPGNKNTEFYEDDEPETPTPAPEVQP